MKSVKIILQILLSMLIVIGACKSTTSDELNQKNDKPLKIVFITTCVGEDFFKPVIKGINDAAKLLGVECSFIGTEEVDLEALAAIYHLWLFAILKMNN